MTYSRALNYRQPAYRSPSGPEFNPLVSAKHPVPEVMNGTIDLRALSREQRRGLLEGPTITLTGGGNFPGQAHKHAFTATSLWANNRIQSRGVTSVLELPLSAARADMQALKVMIGWISTLGGYKLCAVPMGANAVEACKIYHAATVLDMRTHVFHIAAYFHGYIDDQSTFPTNDELNAMQAAFHPDTKVYKHLVKDLAHRRHKKQIPDTEDFTAYLKTQSTLSHAMDDIDAKFIAERKVAKKAAQDQRKKRLVEDRREEKKYHREEFEAVLKAAHGGRVAGYGMAV